MFKNETHSLFSCILQLCLTHNFGKSTYKQGQKLINFNFSWLAMMSSKILIKEFSKKKLLHNVNNPNLKNIGKFQVDMPLNARVIAVQSPENSYTFILLQPCLWAKECWATIPFSHITQQKIIQLLWLITLFSLIQTTSNLVQRNLYGLIGHIKILHKLIMICKIMFLMASYANHQ